MQITEQEKIEDKNNPVQTISEKNKLIVKNTLALYFRQIIILIVSLYTSRVILRTLGVSDFGISNVVGGVVGMLSFLTSSLAETTQRFLSVEIGKNDTRRQKQIFSNSLFLHIIFIVIAVIIAQTIGLWFVQNKLVIPPERAFAAFWVYQFSVISFAVSVFFAPFEGAIRAHEKFSFYAKISIFDVVMKLVSVFLLVYLPYDKLIAYSLLITFVLLTGKVIIYIYCHKHFEECRIKISFEKENTKNLLGYNFFTIINTVSAVIRHQGLNIILNLYYGPLLNAAQGIADKIHSALTSFTNNAAIATQPQIIMSYAQNDRDRLWKLITTSSRLFFYLLLITSLPFILEIETVLYIWLGEYPDYTAIFTRLFLIEMLVIIPFTPVVYANYAVGKLLPTSITNVTSRILILFIALFIGINNFSPAYIYISAIILQFTACFIGVIIVLKKQLSFSLRDFFLNILLSIIKTLLLVISIPFLVHYFFSNSILNSVLTGVFTVFWSALIIFFIGLNRQEKQMIINKLPPFIKYKKIFSKYL